MAFTRFFDDQARIQKKLEQDTFEGRYQLNVPGPGDNIPFWEDPNIRLQQWGANLQQNTTDFESELRGLTRKLNRDEIDVNNYKKNQIDLGSIPNYGTKDPFVEESRATHPAWTYRNVCQDRWESPWINPLSNTTIDKPFQENIQTRILEKDGFIPKIQSSIYS
jgi:hypothetical protein